jgi:DNA-binding IclR family transcriptional regulator
MIVYLTDNVSGRTSDFAQLLGLKDARVRALLGELIAEGIVVQEGGRRYRVYKLKA